MLVDDIVVSTELANPARSHYFVNQVRSEREPIEVVAVDIIVDLILYCYYFLDPAQDRNMNMKNEFLSF